MIMAHSTTTPMTEPLSRRYCNYLIQGTFMFPRWFMSTEMTPVNDGGYDWKRVSNMIQDRPAYERLKQFAFIDENPIIMKGEKS